MNSPLEFVQQLFAKLGAKYIIVNDTQGYCTSSMPCKLSRLTNNETDQGVIEKNAWIAFLNGLEEH